MARLCLKRDTSRFKKQYEIPKTYQRELIQRNKQKKNIITAVIQSSQWSLPICYY